MRETIITTVSTIKFLGVTLDENLTFKDHVNKVTSNISISLGVMRRLHCQCMHINSLCIFLQKDLHHKSQLLKLLYI